MKFISEHPELAQLAKNQKTALKTLQKKRAKKQFKMNPWWWPIWNDTQEAEASIENNGCQDLTNDTVIASSEEDAKKAQADIKAHRQLNPSWQWPY